MTALLAHRGLLLAAAIAGGGGGPVDPFLYPFTGTLAQANGAGLGWTGLLSRDVTNQVLSFTTYDAGGAAVAYGALPDLSVGLANVRTFDFSAGRGAVEVGTTLPVLSYSDQDTVVASLNFGLLDFSHSFTVSVGMGFHNGAMRFSVRVQVDGLEIYYQTNNTVPIYQVDVQTDAAGGRLVVLINGIPITLPAHTFTPGRYGMFPIVRQSGGINAGDYGKTVVLDVRSNHAAITAVALPTGTKDGGGSVIEAAASGDAVLALFTGGRTGAVFAPDDLSTLFQDAAGTTPVAADGDPVGKWASRYGGRTYDLTSAGTARPTWVNNSGSPYLHGDGIDDVLSRLGDDLFAGSSDGVLLLAMRINNATGVAVAAANRGASIINPQLYLSGGGTSWNGYWSGISGATGTSATVPIGDLALVALRRDSSTELQYKDGVLVSTSGVSLSGSDPGNDFFLFNYTGGYATPMDLIACVGISGTVTDQELATMHTWAAIKTGGYL